MVTLTFVVHKNHPRLSVYFYSQLCLKYIRKETSESDYVDILVGHIYMCECLCVYVYRQTVEESKGDNVPFGENVM